MSVRILDERPPFAMCPLSKRTPGETSFINVAKGSWAMGISQQWRAWHQTAEVGWGTQERNQGSESVPKQCQPALSHPPLPWWLRWQRICLQCRRPEFNPWVREDPLEKGVAIHFPVRSVLWSDT